MIGPDRFSRVTAAAVVPEQVVPYVRAVAGSAARVVGGCVGYEFEGRMVLVGATPCTTRATSRPWPRRSTRRSLGPG